MRTLGPVSFVVLLLSASAALGAPPAPAPRVKAPIAKVPTTPAARPPTAKVTLDAGHPSYLHELRDRAAAGNLDLSSHLPLQGIPKEHKPLVRAIVSAGLSAYVAQGIEAESAAYDKGAHYNAMPVPRLGVTGLVTAPPEVVGTRQVVGSERVSVRDTYRKVMAAHDDPRMVAANKEVELAKLRYEASGGSTGKDYMDRYRATVVKAQDARTNVLHDLWNQNIGNDTLRAYNQLGPEGQRAEYFLKDVVRTETVTSPSVPAPPKSYRAHLYNTLLNLSPNALITEEPPPNTLRSALKKMTDARPTEYLAVYALTHELFEDVTNASELKAQVKAQVAKLSPVERNLYVLFAELSRDADLAAAPSDAPRAPERRRDLAIVRALQEALGAQTDGKEVNLKSVAAPRKAGPSGYALALMINHADRNDSWQSSMFGKTRVRYEGAHAAPWVD